MGKLMHSKDRGFDSNHLLAEMTVINEKLKIFNPGINLLGSKSEHAHTFKIYDLQPISVKTKIFEGFQTYSNILTSSIEYAQNHNREKSLVWGALRSLKLRFDDHLFERLLDDDIIEIYRSDNLQVFRNLKFHEVCSFHFPELFIKQWPELFNRDSFITNQILSAAQAAFQNSDLEPISTQHIPEHDLVEISYPEGLKMKMKLKTLYPLSDASGKIAYILAVSRVKLKDRRKQIDYSNVYTI